MRNNIAIIYIILICALTVCAISAKRSKQRISNSVMLLCASLLIPVIGNFIIIGVKIAVDAEFPLCDADAI